MSGRRMLTNCETWTSFFFASKGPAKKLIVEKLEEFGLPFVDVGMGVYLTEGSLGGILQGHDEHAGAARPCAKQDFFLGRRRPQ